MHTSMRLNLYNIIPNGLRINVEPSTCLVMQTCRHKLSTHYDCLQEHSPHVSELQCSCLVYGTQCIYMHVYAHNSNTLVSAVELAM